MNNWNWILKAIHSSIKKPFMDKSNKIMQDIYTENYKMLLREIAEDPNK